ncbi:MAG: hypothetical protein U0164_01870 [Gemmatimonadaceae bacterium]
MIGASSGSSPAGRASHNRQQVPGPQLGNCHRQHRTRRTLRLRSRGLLDDGLRGFGVPCAEDKALIDRFDVDSKIGPASGDLR